jgi:hypothetical protein
VCSSFSLQLKRIHFITTKFTRRAGETLDFKMEAAARSRATPDSSKPLSRAEFHFSILPAGMAIRCHVSLLLFFSTKRHFDGSLN